jgi:hypothetical protein
MTRAGLVFAVLLAAAVPARAAWTVVKEWTGTGSKVMESFDVVAKEWRVNWSATSERDGLGSISVLVFTSDKKLVASATGHVGQPDVTYVHEGPGRYYVEVRAMDASWKVTVEDDK